MSIADSPATDARAVALDYHSRGWAVLPIPRRSKIPTLTKWQTLRLTAEDLAREIRDPRANVGVLLGEPSGWLIDVDLDHPLAVEMADEYLPATGAEFGRASKPRSHRLYVVTAPVETHQRRLPKVDGKAPMVVELRSTGAQTVFPGSVRGAEKPNEVDERIEWHADEPPAEIAPEELQAAVDALADAVEARLGLSRTPAPSVNEHAKRTTTGIIDRARKYIAKMPAAIAGSGGHDATFNVACELYRFGLADDDARALLDEYNGRCEPPWNDKELAHKLADARAVVEAAGEFGMRVNESNGNAAGCGMGNSGMPRIDAGEHNLAIVTNAAWSAIERANRPARLFQYAGRPARIETNDGGEPAIVTLDVDRMRHETARVADWFKITGKGDEQTEGAAKPPVDVVKDMLAMPNQPLPKLARIVEAPIVAADGTVCTTPGYHTASRTFYAPAPGFIVPDVSTSPTLAERTQARALICDELLGDFPFKGPSELAHAVALALLPFARELVDGPTPLHLFEKPSPGTGATLLVDVLAFPALGRPIAAMTEGRDEDEWRKRITSKLLTGASFLLIDNLRRRLDTAAVASAITSPSYEDRMLGASQMVKIPVRCCWLATGNNPLLSSEMSRRTVRIRLDAKCDQPWLRDESQFRHPKLRQWVAENRGRLVWAALTLIRAWTVEGRPAGPKSLGMFEGWAATLGGILGVAGIDGFLGNLQEFYAESDFEGGAWRIFVAAWWRQHRGREVGVVDLFALIGDDVSLPLGDGNERSQKTRLGKLIGDMRDRVFIVKTDDGDTTLRIERAGERQRASLWRLASPDTQLKSERGERCELNSTPTHARAHTREASTPLAENVPNVHHVHSDDDWHASLGPSVEWK